MQFPRHSKGGSKLEGQYLQGAEASKQESHRLVLWSIRVSRDAAKLTQWFLFHFSMCKHSSNAFYLVLTDEQEQAEGKRTMPLPLLLSHFSRVRLSATPWTMARQAPLSMGFSRQEYWGGQPFPSPIK